VWARKCVACTTEVWYLTEEQDFKSGFTELAVAHVESVVNERYGTAGL